MLLNLSSDQEFFRDTTAKFLREQVPVGEIRRLRDEPAGFATNRPRGGTNLHLPEAVHVARADGLRRS